MAALWKSSRVLSGFGSKSDSTSLESTLKEATHSEKVDVPKDALNFISQSSHHEDDRRMIMRHLHTCLNDLSSRKWRCMYAGLSVVEHLLLHGSPNLVAETAAGMHFDLTQRLSFLEKFEYSYDKRVEGMIRRKALSLRGSFLEKQQQQVLASSEVTKKKPVVFHNDDTDDDLSDSELERSSSKFPLGRAANLLEESTTDGESSASVGPSPRSSPDSDPDLLAMGSPRAAAINKAAQDLLDLLGVDAVTQSVLPEAASIDFLQINAGLADTELSSQPTSRVEDVFWTSSEFITAGPPISFRLMRAWRTRGCLRSLHQE